MRRSTLPVNLAQSAHALAGFFKLSVVLPEPDASETCFVLATYCQLRYQRSPDVVNRSGEIVINRRRARRSFALLCLQLFELGGEYQHPLVFETQPAVEQKLHSAFQYKAFM